MSEQRQTNERGHEAHKNRVGGRRREIDPRSEVFLRFLPVRDCSSFPFGITQPLLGWATLMKARCSTTAARECGLLSPANLSVDDDDDVRKQLRIHRAVHELIKRMECQTEESISEMAGTTTTIENKKFRFRL